MTARTRAPRRVLTRGALALRLLVAGFVGASGAASAHVALDSNGRFRHQDHSRRLLVWNAVDDAGWRRATRRAQISWDKTMFPALEFDTAESLRSSVLHVLDGNYGETGWIGYADDCRITEATGIPASTSSTAGVEAPSTSRRWHATSSGTSRASPTATTRATA